MDWKQRQEQNQYSGRHKSADRFKDDNKTNMVATRQLLDSKKDNNKANAVVMSQLIDSKQRRQQNQYGGHKSADGFKEKKTTKPIR